MPTQVIEPKRLYHANMVKTKLTLRRTGDDLQIFVMLATASAFAPVATRVL